MRHRASESDRAFRNAFESGEVTPEEFDHRAHLRLAYVLLVELPMENAFIAMRSALRSFLAASGIQAQKYHDTLTRAWVMAVRHFMQHSAACRSADEFIDANPEMLDSGIMMTHYSAELLFSNEARERFVEPDLDPIPRYDGAAN